MGFELGQLHSVMRQHYINIGLELKAISNQVVAEPDDDPF